MQFGIFGRRKSRTDAAEPPKKLGDFAIVRATREIRELDRIVPAGATGTIVYTHQSGNAFEVEFTTPVHIVIGADRSALELV